MFFLGSDDGSRLYLDGKLVINNDGLHGMKTVRKRIRLSAGTHPIVVTYFDNGGGDGLSLSWSGPGFKRQPISAKKLSIRGAETLRDVVIRAFGQVPGNDAEKFKALASLIREGKHRISAVRAMKQVPQTAWVKAEVQPLAENLSLQISKIPAKYRTSRSALEAMELVDALAEQLPKEQKLKFQATLAQLKIQVIRIGTVPHRMIYDKAVIAVQAGKTVEFVLTNSDSMPHNFAIVKPGAMEEIGKLAEDTAQAKDAIERHYIPKSDKILLSSRLLNNGDTQALSFEVPKVPGVYSYVCTYPGHWRRMYGALYVVADLEAYAKNKTAYLKEHPLPIRDELLKYSTKGKEWKFEDLVASLKPLEKRSFEVGQHVFKVANCVACHKLNNEGQELGPDLTKLEPKKRNPEHVLRSILEPSKEIEKKFQSYRFQLKSGKVVTGMIVKEDKQQVTVLTDPLAKQKPRVIKTSSIDSREVSKVSIMPKGLLDKLSREEILDLIAYVYARGDMKQPIFAPHHKK